MELLYLLYGILFVALGLGLLFGLNTWFHWGRQFFTTDSGNLQAWIYILQTVILVGTLLYIGDQTASLKKTVKTNTVQLLVSGQREVLGKILEHPPLYDAITGQDVPKDGASQIYLSMVFNHGFNTFALRKEGYIDDDWWAAITRDMQNVMRHGALTKWWPRVKQYYPRGYQQFIDQCVLTDGKGDSQCAD